ncbi:MAG: hypothetical protein NUV77_03695 [Thermoguttaceae bacterium]|jgi:hypothetical protein|nr:hypothetical protein [Thermoguttaceae bacterium]
MIDAEVAAREGLVLVFAADQRPFRYTGGSGVVNRFCVLQPLMTLDGDRIDASRQGFPNRAKVWWMLRDDIAEEQVVPGSLWTSRIELAAKWEAKDPESDKYQAKVRDIQPGGQELIEILPVAAPEPDLAYFQRGKKLDWPRPTTPQVMLRGTRAVLGPLKARWLPEHRQLEFSAVSAGNPEVLRVPVDRFNAIVREEHFTIALNEYDPQSEKTTSVVRLTRQAWLQLDKLRAAGETLDASTDAQVINWAMKRYRVTHAQAEPVKKFFARIAEDDAAGDDQLAAAKLKRLRELEQDAERVLALGESIAQSVAETPAFEDLVRRHLDAIVAQKIGEQVALRQEEIRRRTQAEERQLEAVQASLRRLSADFEKRAAAQDEEFKARWDDRIRQLEQRERAVQDRERAVAEQEESLHLRLERVIQRYQNEAQKVGDDLVAQLPILRRMGLGAGADADLASDAEPAELRLPYWLKEEPTASFTEPIDEATFLAQFQRVVERRGFSFHLEDLLNFHVCVKIGGLCVLAGPSGTGKSSLPRLYAEALGWKNRYLQVPVRPDWLDDRDFLGAYNALARRFEPATAGVADHLIAAMLANQRGLGDIYLISLDEMNLARVEHYFAQFLSILECPIEERNIALFAPGLARPSDPYAPYQSVHVGENVRFLGTVNIDETTHFFSPKVLDRCQVVSFAPPDLAAARQGDSSDAIGGVIPVHLNTYLGWSRPPDPTGPARDFLLQVAGILRRSRLVLGIRQFDRMLRYVASARPFLSEDKALDFQLMQVVLPKLRRTAAGFEETLQGLRELIKPERCPRTADLLARIAEAGLENEYFQLL